MDTELVAGLIARQFPCWRHLAVRPVRSPGWDNHIFRLGETLSVRLPTAPRYVAQVEKEHRWLPRLAPRLPLPIPVPVARGDPDLGYPWQWSVYEWILGETAAVIRIAESTPFAQDLGLLLRRLQGIGATDGPEPGGHNFFRGAHPRVYDGETRQALLSLDEELTTAAAEVWQESLQSEWTKSPVWILGDLASGNLLVRDGRLGAVIDFGGCGVGDPACDLTVAWTMISGKSRLAFCSAVQLDDETWSRARGWAVWKALTTLSGAEKAGTS